jgi:hypothetical protein
MARGYDNGKVEQGCLLDLRFVEGTGGIGVRTHDWAKPHHLVTLVTAVTWTAAPSGLTVLDFNGTSDRLICLAAASADLAFTSGDFSGVVWVCPDAVGNRYFMMKGAAGTGWAFWLSGVTPFLCFTTEQAGPVYQTTVGGGQFVTSAWQLVGFSRSGVAARLYLNGLDCTSGPATHIDPASAAAGDFSIGSTVGGGAGWINGDMSRPRLWGCELTLDEHWAIFERERHLYNV